MKHIETLIGDGGSITVGALEPVKGMRTFDTVENRGYVLVHAP